MASDNLILRGGLYHARLSIPADVRPILNRSEFTQALKTGSKSEAQLLKVPYVHRWKQEIAAARSKIKGTDKDWQELALQRSQEIEARQQTGLMNLITNKLKDGIDLTFTELDFRMLGYALELSIHEVNSNRKIKDDFYYEKEKPYAEYLAFEEKWKDKGNEISLEEKIQRFNEFIEINKTINIYRIAKTSPIPVSKHTELHQIINDPKYYTPKSPFTQLRIEAFRKYQTETKGIIQKTVDTQISRIEKIRDWLEVHKKELSYESISEFLESQDKLSGKTKKQWIYAGQSFWKWAIKYDSFFKENFKGATPPFEGHEFASEKSKGGRKRDTNWKAFTLDQLETIYSEAVNQGKQRIVDAITIAAYTGFRIEEVYKISKASIIKEEGIESFSIEDAKTEAGVRIVPIHPNIKAKVQALLAESKDGYLLPSTGGNKYGIRSDAMSKAFGRLKTELGFERLHVFHSIRKTMITQLQRADIPGVLIAEIVGHETGTITYDVYAAGHSAKQKLNAISKLQYDFIK